ncbi:MAG TPA: hypothetical protein VM286_00670 [Candidatus Thermoplasmatota archaeon]|nr:hypothetical protein [Candidatus Thermoplasmatota archaeon]
MALLRPCSTSAGFTATPEPPLRMDMRLLKESLLRDAYQIVVDARIILIVRKATGAGPAVESSVYDNGKVLVKTTDRAAAEAAYERLASHLAVASR